MENHSSRKYVNAAEAVKVIKSNDHVYIHSVAAAPQALIKAMTSRSAELSKVKVYHLHTEGPAPYAAPEMAGSFEVNAFFVGSNVRDAIRSTRGNYIPIFLSEVPILFREGIIPLDVALISVSPPDKNGYCSLGTSVDTTRAAIEAARIVIAQVNAHVPLTHGDGFLHINDIDYLVESNQALPTATPGPLSDVEKTIGQYVAELIEDRSTLQMGIGAIPNAVLAVLNNHKDLGIHTEMFSDGLIPLVESGVITGKYKAGHKGKIVSSFLMGSQKLYDFVNNNPMVRLLDCDYVNSTQVIRKHPRMVAINSAVEIDLTGQVCADSIGSQIYSGVGGQMDFIRGASLSPGGKPIIALPSVTNRGESKISVTLKPGAGVVTTRSHVQYVVTEWGTVNLYGKNIAERCKALVSISHPNHRERLAKEAFDTYKVFM